MRVIFLNRFFFPDHSATSQLLADLAFHLAGLGWEVHVIASRQRYDDAQANLAQEESVTGVHVHRVWTTGYGRTPLLGRVLDYLSFYTSAAWRLWCLTDRSVVVIAKTDPPLISVVAALVVGLRGARLVNWLQDIFPEVATVLGVRLARGGLGGILRYVRGISLRAAMRNVVLGDGAAAYLCQQGISSKRIAVIHNWADGEAIQPLPCEANALRRSWGLESKFTVVYSGNMGRVHEFDTILAAAEKLMLEGHHEIIFLFVGGGFCRERLKREVRERQLANVVFKPYQAREMLQQSLGAADVHLVTLRPGVERFVVPSKFYGIAAAGRPTVFIGDPEGEIGRIVIEEDCGRVVREGDCEGLAALIRELRDEEALRRRLGANARRVFEQKFERRIALDKWQQLLVEVASKP